MNTYKINDVHIIVMSLSKIETKTGFILADSPATYKFIRNAVFKHFRNKNTIT